LVLGVVPLERICATHRARFGFHAAWMLDRDGRPVTSPLGTQTLWSVYPAAVRRWISTHGGLSGNMIFMQGRDLDGIITNCDRDARSVRRLKPNPVRYESASASSDRRCPHRARAPATTVAPMLLARADAVLEWTLFPASRESASGP